MGLQPGDTVTLRQLAAGMLLPSGNDAAAAAAVRIAGSEAAFVREMNRRAEAMGLTGTHYANPHGLDAPGHGSTARDLARLAAAALENEDFRALCGLEELRLAYGNPPYNRTLYTTNALLERFPEAIGVKTGYTDGAGFCLVSAAERDGTTPDYRHAGRGGCDRHPHPPLRALFPAAGPGGPVRLHRRADGAGGGRRRRGGLPPAGG